MSPNQDYVLSLPEIMIARQFSVDQRNFFRFVGNDGILTHEKSFDEIMTKAKMVAIDLKMKGLKAGDKVILIYTPSLDFIEAFAGCLLSGVVPCAIMPPDPRGSDTNFLSQVCENSRAKLILTNKAYKMLMNWANIGKWTSLKKKLQWPDLPWVVTDTIFHPVKEFSFNPPKPQDLAFLQYTSGSTSTPKGVRITHRNIAHQLQFIAQGVRMNVQSSICMWVPHYHDFGLNVGILGSLWGNGSLTMTSPLYFLKRPLLWIEMMHRFRCTHSVSPNFGLDLVVKRTRPSETKEYDLSSVECIGLGAEPIIGATVDRFFERFSENGLKLSSLSGCYGLAEHVAGVTNDGQSRIEVDSEALLNQRKILFSTGKSSKTLIGCGPVSGDIKIKIADPETFQVLSPGEVGEIFVDSPSKADGFEGMADSSAVFENMLIPDDGHRYLRTGDLGAIIEDQLYITGRIKELIIVNGKNFYPGDIEDAARYAHPKIRPGGLAAFSLQKDSSESICLLVELVDEMEKAGYEQVIRHIRQAVLSKIPSSTIDTLILGKKGLIPKTSSGKVQRLKCRDLVTDTASSFWKNVLFDGSSKETISVEKVDNDIDDPELIKFIGIVEKYLGRPLSIQDLHCSPSDVGLDSMCLMEIATDIEQITDREVNSSLLVEAKTIIELAQTLGMARTDQQLKANVKVFSKLTKTIISKASPFSRDAIVLSSDENLEQLSGVQTSKKMNWNSYIEVKPDQDLVVVLNTDSSETFSILENCRKLISMLQSKSFTAALRVVTISTKKFNPCQSAVWGFLNSFRHENKNLDCHLISLNSWEDFDLDNILSASADLIISSQAHYVHQLVAQNMSSSPEDSWGGTGVVCGQDGALLRKACLFLTNTCGVDEILIDKGVELEGETQVLLEDIQAMGIRVRKLNEDDSASVVDNQKLWLIGIARHPNLGPANRQTQGRMESAFRDGPGVVERLKGYLKVSPSSQHQFIILSDQPGWFGGANQAAWHASFFALEEAVQDLASQGYKAKFVSYGPRQGESVGREMKQVWAKKNIHQLPAQDSLEFLKEIIHSELISCFVCASSNSTLEL